MSQLQWQKTTMSQLLKQQDFLHQLHVSRDEAALTPGGIYVDRHLSHTAREVHRLSRHHLDCHWTPRSIIVGVGAATKVDSFGDAVTDLLP